MLTSFPTVHKGITLAQRVTKLPSPAPTPRTFPPPMDIPIPPASSGGPFCYSVEAAAHNLNLVTPAPQTSSPTTFRRVIRLCKPLGQRNGKTPDWPAPRASKRLRVVR